MRRMWGMRWRVLAFAAVLAVPTAAYAIIIDVWDDVNVSCSEATQHDVNYQMTGGLEYSWAQGTHSQGLPYDCVQWWKTGWFSQPFVGFSGYASQCAVSPAPVSVTVELKVVGTGCSTLNTNQSQQIISETAVEVTAGTDVPDSQYVWGGYFHSGNNYSHASLVADLDDTNGSLGTGLYSSESMF